MGVEFVRSAFQGFWRFFESQPNVLVKGQYYFIGDDVPHVPFFHDFGSDFWRDGDVLPVVGEEDIPPPLGHDRRLPWSWVPGISVSDPPRAIPVGTATDFAADHTFPFLPAVELLGGFDTRCIFPCQNVPGKITQDLFCFAVNDCGYLLAMMLLQKYVESEDHPSFTTAAQMLLGADAVITFDDGTDEFPPLAVIQTPRNNVVIHSGTSTATQWYLQFTQAYNGPTDFGTFSTLPIWFRASTRLLDLLWTIGADPTLPFILHGHSYGGAASVIAAIRFHAANPTVRLRVTTSGSPKPGDARVQAQLKQFESLAVITTEDIVPRIPPSNAMKIVLQGAFPLLPDSFFGTFVPYNEYLYLGVGGEWTYGAYTDLPALQFLNVWIFSFVLGFVNSVMAHWSSFYVTEVRIHCPCPELPFTNAWYIFNFDTIDCLVAPLLFNGEGDEARTNTAPPLLEFNGVGVGPRVDVPAKLILNGTGIGDNLAAELVFNGSGIGENDAANLVFGGGNIPGILCPGALPVAWGFTVSGENKSVAAQFWYLLDINEFDLYRVIQSSTPSTGWIGQVYTGDNCSGLTSRGFMLADGAHIDFSYNSTGHKAFVSVITTLTSPVSFGEQFINLSIEGLNVTGIILAYGGSSAPAGFLLCDGSAVSRTTYADLFAAIGTTWGVGDGSTTFNVPDLRGRSVVGSGTGSGLSARTVGQTGGEETHVLTIAELAAHDHDYMAGAATVALNLPTGGTLSWPATGIRQSINRTAVVSKGGDGAHNTMHPFGVCAFIIKT